MSGQRIRLVLDKECHNQIALEHYPDTWPADDKGEVGIRVQGLVVLNRRGLRNLAEVCREMADDMRGGGCPYTHPHPKPSCWKPKFGETEKNWCPSCKSFPGECP